jgi:hypothetical protein
VPAVPPAPGALQICSDFVEHVTTRNRGISLPDVGTQTLLRGTTGTTMRPNVELVTAANEA